MKPSNFRSFPFDSVLHNSESEQVAKNIMGILWRTGDEWRLLSWKEYKAYREMDGHFTESEKDYFDKVVGFCVAEASANAFCNGWGKE